MSSSPSLEAHAGDQSVISDARRKCWLDVRAGDQPLRGLRVTKKGGRGSNEGALEFPPV